MTAKVSKADLLSRIEGLDHIPTVPAVLAPLLRYLEQPLEQLDVQKVTDMIGQDKALAAQCLQMANSPLFGRWQKSTHSAAPLLASASSASAILPCLVVCST